MDARNRLALYGAYFLGVAGIGFTLPYLPLYLGEQGLSDRQIGLISTLAALAGLAQFPLGIWSDRIGRRKPFLVVALVGLTLVTLLLPYARNLFWLGILVVLFAENGLCRAVMESLSGAEAASLAGPDRVGAALGALRFWKPIAIILVAGVGSVCFDRWGPQTILLGLGGAQVVGILLATMIREKPRSRSAAPTAARPAATGPAERSAGGRRFDGALAAFVAAMVLFHAANAPGGVYLGLFMKRDLSAPSHVLSYAFVVSMIAWMLVVLPGGRLADRLGRRPLLIAGWILMSVRLALIAVARSAGDVLLIQFLDGAANGIFAVLAAAWVTDRLGDVARAGEAQAIVGTSLVLGSAIGPSVAGFLVEPLGYRGLFGLMAGVGAVATALVVWCVPESLRRGAAGRLPVPGGGQSETSSPAELTVAGSAAAQETSGAYRV